MEKHGGPAYVIPVETLPELNVGFSIRGPWSSYLSRVVRIKPGEKILLTDFSGRGLEANIIDVANHEVQVQTVHLIEEKKPDVSLGLVLSIPQDISGLRHVVEHAVGLGVFEIQPLFTSYSLSAKKWKEKTIHQVESWIEESCRQCQRLRKPKLNQAVNLEVFREQAKKDLHILTLEPIYHTSSSNMINLTDNPFLWVWFGAEGGWSSQEVDSMLSLDNHHVVTLGPRILRQATAVASGLAIIQKSCEKDSWTNIDRQC